MDIHLRTLRNKQEFDDENGVAEKLGISSALWSMFGVVWPSSLVLAHHLLDVDFKNKTILEVGCGIGLTSLLLNRLEADVTATDYHPQAESFMNYNTKLNNDPRIPFFRTGWSDPKTDMGEFDLIIGSDLLYEDGHVDKLSLFFEQHSQSGTEIILVDPGRGRQRKFGRCMSSLGFSHEIKIPKKEGYLDDMFNGRILKFK